ncbi:helix-turn-helix domain-containing protein [Acinetobacter sp. SwsAc6]|uniref:helix-turn-helix domain-containing protein n=1 Tax=Acinetobacter sp. SwsAc6 TaxID=2749439 RepID=UPI0015BED3C3|nr:helix-turn-helix domain-containing protein [Acinetobacter sp. SwsAc6]NWK76107.1 helix-turn-helix domain-containing protein [Acinetobacter sp. SwsAc6]
MVLKHKQKKITKDRLLLTTKEAARLLGYAEQTLRKWALYENGPINPIRHGRSLRWSKAEVYKFAGVKEEA